MTLTRRDGDDYGTSQADIQAVILAYSHGEYVAEQFGDAVCTCGQRATQIRTAAPSRSSRITVGVALYRESEDVRWLYLGCRCTVCGLVAVYGDWKNEFIGYRELLAQV